MLHRLDPVIPKEYFAKDSFSFCKEIQKVSSSNKVTILSDICSLFTAVNLIFDKCPDLKITRQKLKHLFEFATSGTHFFFDGNCCNQIDGAAMGSPFGPVLVNIFMGFHEKRFTLNSH